MLQSRFEPKKAEPENAEPKVEKWPLGGLTKPEPWSLGGEVVQHFRSFFVSPLQTSNGLWVKLD